MLFDEVVDRWDNVDCEPPPVLLDNCHQLFQDDVNEILSSDMNAMYSAVQSNDTTQ